MPNTDRSVTPPSQIDHVPNSQFLSPRRSNGYATSQASPLNDTQTQPYSQFLPPVSYSYEVEDEEKEGVWGYLLDNYRNNDTLVLRHRASCPGPKQLKNQEVQKTVPKQQYVDEETNFEQQKISEKGKSKEALSSGYLIGRHPECGRLVLCVCVGNCRT
jgi:serine/threonine-protein kinase Chk2